MTTARFRPLRAQLNLPKMIRNHPADPAMYIPQRFQQTDPDKVASFIKTHPFGALFSCDDKGTVIGTHLPFAMTNSPAGTLTLCSHLAKANGQAGQLASRKVLVVFSGPHAYIPPRLYDSPVSVPTWNYISIHLWGKCQLTVAEDSAQLMRRFIEEFDSSYLPVWETLPPEYIARMLANIVWFRIEVTETQAAYKLSQNKTSIEQQRIADYLLTLGNDAARDVGRAMKTNLSDSAG